MSDHNFSAHAKGPILRVLLILMCVLIGILILFFGAGFFNMLNQGSKDPSTITVTGDGEVIVKPDLALVNFSVVTEADSAAKAMTDATEKMNQVIKAMKDSGIKEKDLKTTSFNVSPRYEFSQSSWPNPGQRSLIGYEVRQTLEVKIREIDKSGDIIGKAVESGANQVGNLQLTVDNQEKYKNEAREQAIDEAKGKAKELASQLGVRLVKITNFQEGDSPVFFLEASDSMGRGGGESPQIEVGENTIEVNVTISYEIK